MSEKIGVICKKCKKIILIFSKYKSIDCLEPEVFYHMLYHDVYEQKFN